VNHNKATGFERRLELYLTENFKHAFDMERFGNDFWSISGVSQVLRSYVYYTQIMQAEALAAAYRMWRRNWAGPGREYTAGALVWQVDAIRCAVIPIFVFFSSLTSAFSP
jgi:beta-mannosidase